MVILMLKLMIIRKHKLILIMIAKDINMIMEMQIEKSHAPQRMMQP